MKNKQYAPTKCSSIKYRDILENDISDTDHTKCVFFIAFQAKIETKALKAKRPGFTDDRYNETEYYVENGKIFSPFFGLPNIFFLLLVICIDQNYQQAIMG